ncbi:MAG: hypothetical protein Q8Q31_04295 [Nanoarchaeota archaeon]|nr:hypothetical protein [Nanoarchaeota archaeon]
MVELSKIELDLILDNVSNLDFIKALDQAKPLLLFILGMVLYAVFIFKFYRFVAHRDVFKLNLAQYSRSAYPSIQKTFAVLLYILEHIIILPIITFFWFIVFSGILIFLSKETDPYRILLVAISLVGSIRVVSYYSEDLSRDLAKMLPFALLAIFLVDISYFSLERSLDVLSNIPSVWETMLYYLLFIVALELTLRIIYLVIKPILPRNEEENRPKSEILPSI